MSDETQTPPPRQAVEVCVWRRGGGAQPSTTATQQDDQVRDRATTATS